MNLVALGIRLKQHRNHIGLSQFNFAVKLGMSSASKLAEYELGHIRPTVETLTRLSEVLRLDQGEVSDLFSMAGYSPPTRMPERAKIEQVLGEIANNVRDEPYLVYVADYRWRAWLVNPAGWRLFGLTRGELLVRMNRGLSLIDMAFDSRLPWVPTIQQLDEFQRIQAARFKATNARFLHEPYAHDLPGSFRERLLAHDYAGFAAKWDASDPTKLDGVPAQAMARFRVSRGEFSAAFRVAPILHLNQLFNEVHVMPDLSTPAHAREWMDVQAQLAPGDEPCIEMWRHAPAFYE